MTFTEYLNQTNPVRHATGSILVKRSECKQIFNIHNGETIILDFVLNGKRSTYSYFKPSNSNILYTTDNDGNPQFLSVFRLID